MTCLSQKGQRSVATVLVKPRITVVDAQKQAALHAHTSIAVHTAGYPLAYHMSIRKWYAIYAT